MVLYLISWNFQPNLYQSFHRYQIKIVTPSGGVGRAIQLSIPRVGREDTGVYVCAAANAHGRSNAEYTLIVEGEAQLINRIRFL